MNSGKLLLLCLCATIAGVVSGDNYCCNFDDDTCNWANTGSYEWRWSKDSEPDLAGILDFRAHNSDSMWFQDVDMGGSATNEANYVSGDVTINNGDEITIDFYLHEVVYDGTQRLQLYFEENQGGSEIVAYTYDPGWTTTETTICGTSGMRCCSSYPCDGKFRVYGKLLNYKELLAFDSLTVNKCPVTTTTKTTTTSTTTKTTTQRTTTTTEPPTTQQPTTTTQRTTTTAEPPTSQEPTTTTKKTTTQRTTTTAEPPTTQEPTTTTKKTTTQRTTTTFEPTEESTTSTTTKKTTTQRTTTTSQPSTSQEPTEEPTTKTITTKTTTRHITTTSEPATSQEPTEEPTTKKTTTHRTTTTSEPRTSQEPTTAPPTTAPPAPKFCCTFETGTCGWQLDGWEWSYDEKPDWDTEWKAVTPFNHTGEYVWSENVDSARLTSPTVTIDGDEFQFQLNYYAYTAIKDPTNSIYVYFRSTTGSFALLSILGDTNSQWLPLTVACTQSMPCCNKYPCTGNLVLEASVSSGKTIYAVDNIQSQNECTNSGECCEFEDGELCYLENLEVDSWEWSGLTQPNTTYLPDFTSDGDYLWYQQTGVKEDGSVAGPTFKTETITVFANSTFDLSIYVDTAGSNNPLTVSFVRQSDAKVIVLDYFSDSFDKWETVELRCQSIHGSCCDQAPACNGWLQVSANVRDISAQQTLFYAVDNINIDDKCPN